MDPVTSIPKQSGVALVVSLIILTIVTLLSISAMQSTNLDTKIALNHQFKSLGFAAAESALAIVIGPDLTLIDNFDLPTEVGKVNANIEENFFTSPTADEARDNADLADHPPLRASLRMEYEGEKAGLFFSGHQLDNTTHLFLADAKGTVGETHSKSHNRMQVGLIRHKWN
jgi:type IV pilus assembly protein PilX